MNGVQYLIGAYLGAAVLYGGYLIWLLRRERSLVRQTRRDDERG